MRGENGQALIETALTISILFMLVMGVADLGLIFQTHIAVVNAANAAATYAAANPSNAVDQTSIRNVAMANSSSWHCVSPSTTITGPVADASGAYDKITVNVTCRVSNVTGLMKNVQIKGSAVRRVRP